MAFWEFLLLVWAIGALREFIAFCYYFGIQLEKTPWLAGFQRREIVAFSAIWSALWPILIVAAIWDSLSESRARQPAE